MRYKGGEPLTPSMNAEERKIYERQSLMNRALILLLEC